VKKLDTIISALATTPVATVAATAGVSVTAAGGGGGDSFRRLESVKKTRDILITDPNSKAHLRIGKLKAVGPDRYCPPRHPPHFAPSFLELDDIL
jgi:hypothetical protein